MGLLDGKVVLVTGAGRGVGRCIAQEAAKAGAKVVVNDLGAKEDGTGGEVGPAQSVANEIIAAGGQAIADTHSIADWDQAQAIIQTAMDTYGQLDGVINNAGVLRDSIFHKMTKDAFDELLKINLSGYFYVSRAAAAVFRTQGHGAFVHMSSTSGLIGNMAQANYSAAKMGVVGLSKSIALDMSRYNVRSNCIAPFAWTRLVGTIPDRTPEEKKRVEGLRKLKPELIAPFAVALIADEAADVTGQIFGTRSNEIFLFSQPRPIRSVHAGDGWTPESVVATALPALSASFYDLDRSGDIFTWDPI